MITKCAIYARVSTEDQTEQNQLQPLLDVANQRQYEVLEIYREQASAWKNGHQKELARLIEDARKGKFQIMMVWSLDRLTREGPSKALEYFDKLAGYGVSVYSHQESWTEAPSEYRPLLLAIIGWISEQESKRRSERTKAGMLRAKEEGKHIGRPRKKGAVK